MRPTLCLLAALVLATTACQEAGAPQANVEQNDSAAARGNTPTTDETPTWDDVLRESATFAQTLEISGAEARSVGGCSDGVTCQVGHLTFEPSGAYTWESNIWAGGAPHPSCDRGTWQERDGEVTLTSCRDGATYQADWALTDPANRNLNGLEIGAFAMVRAELPDGETYCPNRCEPFFDRDGQSE